MTPIVIKSNMKCLGSMDDYPESIVKNEPMLFNCDLQHAYKLGGEITKDFLDRVVAHWGRGEYVVDSRVHMLMPEWYPVTEDANMNWYPCIPGWHHDDVPRTRSDNQPNYAEGQDRSEHIICLINGDICATEFAVGTAIFEEPELGSTIYQKWHKEVDKKIAAGELKKISAPSNTLVEFNDRSWHQGTVAVSNGWRWFGRISRYRDKDGNKIARRNARTNETRRQVQVYLSNPHKGW